MVSQNQQKTCILSDINAKSFIKLEVLTASILAHSLRIVFQRNGCLILTEKLV